MKKWKKYIYVYHLLTHDILYSCGQYYMIIKSGVKTRQGWRRTRAAMHNTEAEQPLMTHNEIDIAEGRMSPQSIQSRQPFLRVFSFHFWMQYFPRGYESTEWWNSVKIDYVLPVLLMLPITKFAHSMHIWNGLYTFCSENDPDYSYTNVIE